MFENTNTINDRTYVEHWILSVVFHSLPTSVRFMYAHISENLIRVVKFAIREINWINIKMYYRALVFRKYFACPLWYAIIYIRVEQVVSVGAEYDSMKITAYVYLFLKIFLNILVLRFYKVLINSCKILQFL